MYESTEESDSLYDHPSVREDSLPTCKWNEVLLGIIRTRRIMCLNWQIVDFVQHTLKCQVAIFDNLKMTLLSCALLTYRHLLVLVDPERTVVAKVLNFFFFYYSIVRRIALALLWKDVSFELISWCYPLWKTLNRSQWWVKFLIILDSLE